MKLRVFRETVDGATFVNEKKCDGCIGLRNRWLTEFGQKELVLNLVASRKQLANFLLFLPFPTYIDMLFLALFLVSAASGSSA